MNKNLQEKADVRTPERAMDSELSKSAQTAKATELVNLSRKTHKNVKSTKGFYQTHANTIGKSLFLTGVAIGGVGTFLNDTKLLTASLVLNSGLSYAKGDWKLKTTVAKKANLLAKTTIMVTHGMINNVIGFETGVLDTVVKDKYLSLKKKLRR